MGEAADDGEFLAAGPVLGEGRRRQAGQGRGGGDGEQARAGGNGLHGGLLLVLRSPWGVGRGPRYRAAHERPRLRTAARMERERGSTADRKSTRLNSSH